MKQFFDLKLHAQTTDQTATGWETGTTANYELIKLANESSFINRTQDTGLIVLGLPVVFDRSLPPNKVVLKAGKNTVGAFDL